MGISPESGRPPTHTLMTAAKARDLVDLFGAAEAVPFRKLVM